MTAVRAAYHVHSAWSYDGSWTLPNLARAFARRCYDVVLLCEHDRGFDQNRWDAYRAACRDASDDRVLLVPGIEYANPDNRVHVPVWGRLPFLGEGLSTDALLTLVAEHDAAAVLAHPDRREAWCEVDIGRHPALVGVEWWNRMWDGFKPGTSAARLLEQHPGLVPFVALDFHSRRQFFPLAMTLDIEGPLTVDAVFDALCARRCAARAFGVPERVLKQRAPATTLRGADHLRRHAAKALRRRR
jgi:hypothetical protein